MPDANLEQAVDGIMGAAYGSAVERCMAVSVAVAVGDIADKMIANISDKAESLKVAPWTDSSQMGPSNIKEHKQKIESYIDSGVDRGAKLILDGRKLKIQAMKMVILWSNII